MLSSVPQGIVIIPAVALAFAGVPAAIAAHPRRHIDEPATPQHVGLHSQAPIAEPRDNSPLCLTHPPGQGRRIMRGEAPHAHPRFVGFRRRFGIVPMQGAPRRIALCQ